MISKDVAIYNILPILCVCYLLLYFGSNAIYGLLDCNDRVIFGPWK
jgi:hypothetical protein